MIHLAEHDDIPTLTTSVLSRDTLSPFDVLGALSAALSPDWSVEREVDPGGDISIIVLPTCEDPGCTAFVLYEENGFVQVATISGDSWQSRRPFPTCQRAVAAIVVAARSNPDTERLSRLTPLG
jgi:hypothetical protein